MQLTQRLITYAKRRHAASRLGFGFTGMRNPIVPDALKLSGQTVPLHFPEDKSLFYEIVSIWLDDEYGLKNLESAPKKVIDVGGNLGLFTLFLKSHFPDALVHAYEPNPECVGYFAKNTAALDQVVLYREGLASETGTADLLCDEESTRLTRTQTRQDEAGEVLLTSLETAMNRIGGAVDLLKIDCEGAEWDILDARCALREAAHIRMEYHLWAGKELSDLHKIANAIGFEITFLAPCDQIGFVYLERR